MNAQITFKIRVHFVCIFTAVPIFPILFQISQIGTVVHMHKKRTLEFIVLFCMHVATLPGEISAGEDCVARILNFLTRILNFGEIRHARIRNFVFTRVVGIQELLPSRGERVRAGASPRCVRRCGVFDGSAWRRPSWRRPVRRPAFGCW